MTRYLERALAGTPASAEDWNEHLIAFHRAFPNVTTELIGGFRTADGESSYQRLARHVHEQFSSAERIVDVGCGSGELLYRLDALFNGAAELIGIDLVESELDIARRRLANAKLVCGDAAEMLPVGRVDVVVAHLSFLSMARIRDALLRIHDALLPGGVLTFIIEDVAASESIIAMMAPLMRALHEKYPALNLSVPDRDGVENDGTLRALLEATGFANEINVELVVLSAHLTLDEAVKLAMRGYPFGLLDANAQEVLRERLATSLLHNVENESILVKLPLKLVTARRGNAITNQAITTVTEYK